MPKPRGPNLLHDVQTRRRAMLAVVAVAFACVFALVSGWNPGSWTSEAVIQIGRLAIAICILGRCWCTLYIGGRKARQLVDTGPYSICRNPLYFFSFVGTAGFGAQTGSALVALAFTVLVWGVFRDVVGKEERHLTEALGEPYVRYLVTTPRFLPNPALWRGVEVLEVRPRLVVTTFVDGLMFLLSVPLAMAFAQFQQMGWLPVFLRLP